MTRNPVVIALIVLVSGCAGISFDSGTTEPPDATETPASTVSPAPGTSTPTSGGNTSLTVNATAVTSDTDPWAADDATTALVRVVAFLDRDAARFLGEQVVLLDGESDPLSRLEDVEENARYVNANDTYYANLTITAVNPVVYELRLTETTAAEANRSATPFDALPSSTRSVLEEAVERDAIVLGGSESRNGSVATYYGYDPGDGPFYLSPEHYEEETFGSANSNHTHVRYDGTTYRVDASLFLPENRYTVTRVEESEVDGSAIPFDELSSNQQCVVRGGIDDGGIRTRGGPLFENTSQDTVEHDGEYYRIGNHSHLDYVGYYLLAVSADRAPTGEVFDRYGIVRADALDESVREPMVSAAQSGNYTITDPAVEEETGRLLEEYDFLYWNGTTYRVNSVD